MIFLLFHFYYASYVQNVLLTIHILWSRFSVHWRSCGLPSNQSRQLSGMIFLFYSINQMFRGVITGLKTYGIIFFSASSVLPVERTSGFIYLLTRLFCVLRFWRPWTEFSAETKAREGNNKPTTGGSNQPSSTVGSPKIRPIVACTINSDPNTRLRRKRTTIGISLLGRHQHCQAPPNQSITSTQQEPRQATETKLALIFHPRSICYILQWIIKDNRSSC